MIHVQALIRSHLNTIKYVIIRQPILCLIRLGVAIRIRRIE